jgi:2-oxoglutarate dehydrogenase E2 component (dihydrolipoamide succinyltransferase)
VKITSVAREMMKEYGLSVDDVINGLKRLGKKEVEAVVKLPKEVSGAAVVQPKQISREVKREKMTSLRRKLSERLVAVKNETAMLTTFNEIDMSFVMDLRQKYQDQFVKKYGFKVGFMSFFTKAVALAMDFHPMVNAQIDGDEVVAPQFVDVGIAVSTPKGLMVPIVRNAESKTIPQIELEIKELAEKARSKKISVEELTGGTFTITNGGVFGSLLSTPIINPPQSAILGMHNIVERPVAVNGEIVIRPMMYVALSYDHRIIDGKDSVGFLVKVKEMIENPERMFTGGQEAGKLLLGI